MTKLMPLDRWGCNMSEKRPRWSRRRLLGSCGLATTLALAGCSTPGSDDEESDNGNGSADGSGDGEGGNGGHSQFSLAGDGSAPFRNWLNPAHEVDPADGRDTRQLYQYNDFDLAAEGNWDSILGHRDEVAEAFGDSPESFHSELYLGPMQNGQVQRVFFGDFDTESIGTNLEANGLEQGEELEEYDVYGGTFAVSPDVIINHLEYETVLETYNGQVDRVDEVDENIAYLLDLVPRGMLQTFARRDGYEDIVVDAMTVQGRDEEGQRNHETRTFVFENESVTSIDRAKEVVEDGTFSYEEIPTEESHGRVVMLEVRR